MERSLRNRVIIMKEPAQEPARQRKRRQSRPKKEEIKQEETPSSSTSGPSKTEDDAPADIIPNFRNRLKRSTDELPDICEVDKGGTEKRKKPDSDQDHDEPNVDTHDEEETVNSDQEHIVKFVQNIVSKITLDKHGESSNSQNDDQDNFEAETPEELDQKIDRAMALSYTLNWCHLPIDSDEDKENRSSSVNCSHLTKGLLEDFIQENYDVLAKINSDEVDESHRDDPGLTWCIASLAFDNKQISYILSLCERLFPGCGTNYFLNKVIPKLCIRIFAQVHHMTLTDATLYLLTRPRGTNLR